jgi:hypothetical protein
MTLKSDFLAFFLDLDLLAEPLETRWQVVNEKWSPRRVPPKSPVQIHIFPLDQPAKTHHRWLWKVSFAASFAFCAHGAAGRTPGATVVSGKWKMISATSFYWTEGGGGGAKRRRRRPRPPLWPTTGQILNLNLHRTRVCVCVCVNTVNRKGGTQSIILYM